MSREGTARPKAQPEKHPARRAVIDLTGARWRSQFVRGINPWTLQPAPRANHQTPPPSGVSF